MRDVEQADPGEIAVVGGARERGTFTILATSKAFQILIAGLYSDKPRAVIRELMTNAWDSHVSAGKATLPVKLSLPSCWDPQFAVRDYGTSLSHEDVMGLYTTVFASTKDQDNAQVGKFGLGSKVPFAYADTFGVTTWKDGLKRVYSCFMSAGIPQIMLMHTEHFATVAEKHEALDVMLAHGYEPSAIFAAFGIGAVVDDEDVPAAVNEALGDETGLEVAFPVQPRDADTFTSAAKRVVFGFPVAPVSNVRLLSDSDVQPAIVGTGWKLYQRDYDLGLNGLMVRQGCVLYPVDRSAVLNKVPECTSIEALHGEAIVLDMPIGSVEITPSRESLSYDDTTVANLVQAVDAIFNQFLANANDEVAKQTCLLDAYGARARVLDGITNRTLQRAIAEKMQWRGRRITTQALHVSQQRLELLAKKGLPLYQFDASENKRRRSKYSSSDKGDRIRRCYSMDVTPNTLPTIIYYEQEDSPTYILHRLRAAQAKYGGSGSNLLLARNFSPSRDIKVLTKLWVSMGCPKTPEGQDYPYKFVDLMTLDFEKPDYQRTLADCAVWNSQHGSFKHHYNTPKVPDPDQEDVYYLHTARGVPLWDVPGSGESSTYTLSALWDMFHNIGILPSKAVLVGIPASRKDIAKRLPPAWTFFGDLVQDVYAAHYEPKRAGELQALSELSNDRSATSVKTFFTALNNRETLIEDKDSESLALQIEMLPFLDKGADDQKQLRLRQLEIGNNWLSADQRAEYAEAFKENTDLAKEFWKLVKAHRKAYPLLGRLSSSPTADDWHDIVDYINLRDAKAAPTRHLVSAAQLDADARAVADFENERGFVLPSDEEMPAMQPLRSTGNVIVVHFPVDIAMAA